MTKPTIQPFVQLGLVLDALSNEHLWPGYSCGLTEEEYAEAQDQLQRIHHHNGWFTLDACRQMCREWSKLLQEESMNAWLSAYPSPAQSRQIGLICAGNIPAVGFHDIVCILLSGHKALIKLSKDDALLIPMFMRWLCKFEPSLSERFEFVERLQNFDAVIATGSNNSARYFESYFGHVPHIIRKSRTSVAVLSGEETEEELHALGLDIFTYFGLGCRNVTKVYMPRGMDINRLFGAFYAFRDIGMHAKYANNYDYNKAVWLLNREDLLDNGFILLKEDEQLSCPTASLFYSYYENLDTVEAHLAECRENIQCRVGLGGLKLGSAQQPKWSDYADGVDTMHFLVTLEKK
ncbi:MAG: hypothetical protein RLZZ262_1003 [Bacteroidota bacterium]|jgi:hypothetical protein